MSKQWEALASAQAWEQFKQIIDSMGQMVLEDSQSELEAIEGFRVILRAIAVASEVVLDASVNSPFFMRMDTPVRNVGGDNPDAEYDVAAIDGERRYRIRGNRGTVTYLGFQILGGKGMEPRRMVSYIKDEDIETAADGSFELILSTEKPAEAGTWFPLAPDASAIVVRQYVADRERETLASYDIELLGEAPPVTPPTDAEVAERLVATAWTVAKLTTFHRMLLPELLDTPNLFVAAEAQQIGGSDTTPDNLYMIGSFSVGVDEALIVEFMPPATRYWNLTIENLWHECFDYRLRPRSLTNAHAVTGADGAVRVVIAHEDPGTPNWIDAGGRVRGHMLFRWLDNHEVELPRCRLVALSEARGGAPDGTGA